MTWPSERPPAVAGTFYPAGPAQLRATVDALLEPVLPTPGAARLVGVVVPHAGYRYSGPVGASAYAVVRSEARTRRRVLLLGPDHGVGTPGMTVPTVERWATPLGPVLVDSTLRAVALRSGLVAAADAPHAHEHSLEVQLPFLQRALDPGWTVLPVMVGPTAPESVAALVAALLATDDDILLVVSSDLSHYHDDSTARRLDRRTADAITRLDVAAIRDGDACGRHPVRGLLVQARTAGWAVSELDLRTSADTAGDPRRVVGYGAFAIRDGAATDPGAGHEAGATP